jgi:TolB-like protein
MQHYYSKSNFWQIFPLLLLLVLLFPSRSTAAIQENKPSIAIADFDTRSDILSNGEAIQYVINELIRIGRYEVMDKYDVTYIARRDSLHVGGCFSKICLKATGEQLKVDKMFTGSLQRLGSKMNVMLRLLDVDSGVFEKQVVKEFLDIRGNELMMIRITINEMFGLPNDEDMVKKLTMKTDYESAINNPYQLRLRADGPRMGIGVFTGLNAQIMQAKQEDGGFNGNPFMFQFGYQYEKQYLNEGNFQALFEFIPMVSGMDQGRFIPSFTFLNGLRNNRNGWEFAFGPTFNFTKMARGFVDSVGGWHLQQDAYDYPDKTVSYERRLDSRGVVSMSTGFLFAFGRTFKSGKMNIPVNGYVVPGKGGIRFGLSFGWNGRDRYELHR